MHQVMFIFERIKHISGFDVNGSQIVMGALQRHPSQSANHQQFRILRNTESAEPRANSCCCLCCCRPPPQILPIIASPSTTTMPARSCAKPHSRSTKAGLNFPVGRIHRLLKTGNFAKRVGMLTAGERPYVFRFKLQSYLSRSLSGSSPGISDEGSSGACCGSCSPAEEEEG